ncbi:MAG: YMGG-like glycine zipper-containing protein [Candidatus Omnitrophota bacterium]|nr:YMGG-like glycine zipper-containing protein [Candidatus Omnitrophota bacterium]
MRKIGLLILVFSVAAILGCSTTQKGAAIGAGAGAVLGGVIGHQSGHGPGGAGIGAAVGAASGALIGEQMDTKFCSVCGKRFTSGVKYCPVDGTELKPIQK